MGGDLSKEDFIRRFVDHMCKTAGFSHFDDGQAVADYANSVAENYWLGDYLTDETPEDCAESDMDYWGEE